MTDPAKTGGCSTFARTDSIIDGIGVRDARFRAGQALASRDAEELNKEEPGCPGFSTRIDLAWLTRQKQAVVQQIVGHRETSIRGSAREVGDPIDEAQASIRASRFAPGLSDEDRELLLQDAKDRLSEAGIDYDEIINELDVFER